MPYAAVNGVQLWYERAGQGPPVVLGHSSLLDSRQWDGQMPAFAAAHDTVRYDLRYYGRSERAGDGFSEADDLAALLDALGIESAAIVGSSYGAASISTSLSATPTASRLSSWSAAA